MFSALKDRCSIRLFESLQRTTVRNERKGHTRPYRQVVELQEFTCGSMKVYWSLQETGLGLERGLKFEQIERGEGIPAPPATFVKKFFFIYCFVNCSMSFSLFLDVFLSFLVVQTSTLHFIVGDNMLYFLEKLDTPVFLLFEAIFFLW